MKKKVIIKENENSFLISFDKSPSFIKIFNKNGILVRVSRFDSPIQSYSFFGKRGDYFIETDEKISEVKSELREIKRIKQIRIDTASETSLIQFTIDEEVLSHYAIEEAIKKGEIKLEEIKTALLEYFKTGAAQQRNILIPDDPGELALKITLGLIDSNLVQSYKATIIKFNQESERLGKAIDQAKTFSVLMKIKPNFPKQLVKVSKKRPTKKVTAKKEEKKQAPE